MGFIKYNLAMLAHHAVKRSPLFQRSMAAIIEHRACEPEEQRGRQLLLLEQALASAARAPHYLPMFAKAMEIDNPIEVLKALPYLDKDSLRRAPRAFRTTAFSVPAYTSGTTGTPLLLRRSLSCIAREAAGFFSWYQSAGWHPGDLMAVLRGDLVVPVNRVIPPFGLRDYVEDRLVLSSYHLSDRTLPWYIGMIRGSGARFLSAYPSSAFVLADFMRRNAEDPLALDAVFLASETVHDEHKALIEQFIGPVHSHYGMAERVCWMTSCSAGCYHEDTQYGYTEYVPIGEGLYEIVATGLINRAMPLLRYRTGDLAFAPFGWEYRCACGKSGPGCAHIVGRVDDLFVTADGRKIGRLDHVFKGVRHVIAAQIVQREPGVAEIRIMRDAGYSDRDESELRDRLAARAGSGLHITCTYLGHLPRTQNGKFRAVVSYCSPHHHGDTATTI